MARVSDETWTIDGISAHTRPLRGCAPASILAQLRGPAPALDARASARWVVFVVVRRAEALHAPAAACCGGTITPTTPQQSLRKGELHGQRARYRL